MKKLATILIAAVLFISASAFTSIADSTDEKVSPKIQTEFEKNFTSATDVKWSKTNDIYFVTFKLNDQNLSAAYNEEGELVGATRVITFAQLPLNVSLAVQSAYSGYKIDDSVTELIADGQTQYYINAENTKFKVGLKSNSSGNITVERKFKRK